MAHRSEHAAEVELPFLQERQRNLTIVPIALGTRNLEALEGLGTALAETIAADHVACGGAPADGAERDSEHDDGLQSRAPV